MDKSPHSETHQYPRLQVEIHHRIGTLSVEISFTLRQPWTVLFGPSGSGKSTILRAIARLLHPGSAHVQPDELRIPLAPQSPSLFPHWSVADNLTMRRAIPPAVLTGMLSLFRLEALAAKRPRQLSGGEAQRVNLARASTWAAPDGVLLLDEPFTGMDASLRDSLIPGMKAWAAQQNICILSVTHDVAEAFQLNAEVIKIADGKLIAQGPVHLVLADERARLLQQINT